MFSRSLYVGIAMSSATLTFTAGSWSDEKGPSERRRDLPRGNAADGLSPLRRLQHVEERTTSERVVLPEPGRAKDADCFLRIVESHQGQRLAVRKEAAERHPAGAAGFDQRKRGHLDVGRQPFHQRHAPRAVDDD